MRRVNVERWVRGELNPAPLSREAVERIAESRRVLGGASGKAVGHVSNVPNSSRPKKPKS